MAAKDQTRHRQQTDILVFRSLLTVLQLVPPIAGRIASRRFFRPRKSRPLMIDKLESYDITMGGLKVRVYEGGKGPAVLVMHGWESSAARLAVLINALIANNFRVIAFDMPAHGNSSGQDTDILQITDIIIHLAETLGPFAAAIGHSFGGVCLANALKGNLRVNRLVLISTPADLTGIIDKYCQILRIWQPTKVRLVKGIEARLGSLELEQEFKIRPTLQESGVPTLIIHDQQDPIVPFSEAETLCRALTNTSLFPTNNLGHSKIVRNARTIVECITFISRSEKALVSKTEASGFHEVLS